MDWDSPAILWAPWTVSESAEANEEEPTTVVSVRFEDFSEPDSPFAGRSTEVYFVSALNDGTHPAVVDVRTLDGTLFASMAVAPDNYAHTMVHEPFKDGFTVEAKGNGKVHVRAGFDYCKSQGAADAPTACPPSE